MTMKPLAVHRRGPGRPTGARAGQAREAILSAARELLAKRGMPRVTLREVAERAGVQPALVNYYFGAKQELFREVIRGVAAHVRDRIAAEAARPGEPAQRLGNMLRALSAVFSEHPYAPRLLFEHVLFAEDETLDEFVEAYARPNVEAIRGVLEAGRADGKLRDLDITFFGPQVIGMMFFFFLASPLITRIFDLDGIDAGLAERFANSAADLVLHGVMAPLEDAS